MKKEYYLSQTVEFRRFVERRKAEDTARRLSALPLPLRVICAAVDGFWSELRHMRNAGPEYAK